MKPLKSVGAETTKAQDDGLFKLAAKDGGGVSIADEGQDGTIHVNAADGSRWTIDRDGTTRQTRDARR